MNKEELLEKALCCNRCGTCRGVVQDCVPDPDFSTQCPCGMTMFGEYEPAGLMYLARGIAQGDLKWNEDLARVLYSCTMCGYCEDLCQRGYRHTPAITIIEELRNRVPEKLRPTAIKKMADSAAISGSRKLGTLSKYGIVDVSDGGKANTILFIDNYLMGAAAKLKEIGHIIQKTGSKIGCFIKEPLPPVSSDLINGGYPKELDKCMAEIDQRLVQSGIKKVIVYNPESLSVLKRFSTSNVEFISITGFYSALLKKKKGKRIKLPTVTYQDPCHLGRYAKDYAAPREVMKLLGLSLEEMWRSANNSLCCGAGGGVRTAAPDLAKTYAGKRWKEAGATGAKIMITACPNCSMNMRTGKPKDFKVIDMTTLVAQAYGYSGKEGSK